MTDNHLVRVLVVEFDPLHRDLIILALNRGSYAPVVCSDLSQLRHLIEEHHPKVLLIDLNLPGINGLDLLKGLVQDGLLKQSSVIVISAMGFPEIVNQAINMGVDDFLVKPILPDLLLARIQKAINKSI